MYIFPNLYVYNSRKYVWMCNVDLEIWNKIYSTLLIAEFWIIFIFNKEERISNCQKHPARKAFHFHLQCSCWWNRSTVLWNLFSGRSLSHLLPLDRQFWSDRFLVTAYLWEVRDRQSFHWSPRSVSSTSYWWKQNCSGIAHSAVTVRTKLH